MTRPFLLATLVAGLFVGTAAAADDHAGMAGMPGMTPGAAPAESILPAACLAASREPAMPPMTEEGDLDPVQTANRRRWPSWTAR